MRKIALIVFAFLLLTITFSVRTNTRILTANVIDSVGNVIHPYKQELK